MRKMLIILVSLFEVSCLADRYAHLTKIDVVNQDPTKPIQVTFQTSDQQGKIVANNGQVLGKLGKSSLGGSIQNIVFDVKDVQSLDLIAPWKGWDGKAELLIQVKKNGVVTSEMKVQDRDSTLKIIGVKNADSKDVSKTNTYPGEECNKAASIAADVAANTGIALADVAVGATTGGSLNFVNIHAGCHAVQKHGECDMNLEVTVDGQSEHIAISKVEQTTCDGAQ